MAPDRAITVRLSDSQIKVIDALAKRAAREVNGIPVNRPSRSDIIRVCISGYLRDHPDIVAEASEQDAPPDEYMTVEFKIMLPGDVEALAELPGALEDAIEGTGLTHSEIIVRGRPA